MAIAAIKKSNMYETLKANIIAEVDKDTGKLSDAKQVSLFKVGRFTEATWEFLTKELKPHLQLWSPAKLRKVCTVLLLQVLHTEGKDSAP